MVAGAANPTPVLLNAGNAQWDTLGVLAAAGGAIVMALGMYLARRWGSSLPLLALTGWQLTLGGLMLLPAALWLDPPMPALSAANVAGYAYLSLVGALLAYGLWFRGLRLLPPVAVSALGLLSPVAAVILGWGAGAKPARLDAGRHGDGAGQRAVRAAGQQPGPGAGLA